MFDCCNTTNMLLGFQHWQREWEWMTINFTHKHTLEKNGAQLRFSPGLFNLQVALFYVALKFWLNEQGQHHHFSHLGKENDSEANHQSMHAVSLF